MSLRRQVILLAGAGLLAASALGSDGDPNAVPPHLTSTNRPVSWARPLKLPGVSNFYEVTTNLYRGAQPTPEGMKALKAMGIKTVINLRSFHSDQDEVAGTGLQSIRFETEPWRAEEEDVVAFLKAVTDTNNLPAFVHCRRGADRTGLMCAMYRIVVCGWTKQDAIGEMKQGGYHFSPIWENLVRFIRKADIADIQRRMAEPAKTPRPAGG